MSSPSKSKSSSFEIVKSTALVSFCFASLSNSHLFRKLLWSSDKVSYLVVKVPGFKPARYLNFFNFLKILGLSGESGDITQIAFGYLYNSMELQRLTLSIHAVRLV